MVLRADTSVTSHDYEDGSFSGYPAVLQAGTAVFVNSYGEPTVKRYSGNPLTKGTEVAQGGYTGTGWSGFAPRSVAVIAPTPTVIRNHTFVNIDNGRPINRPGKGDPKPDPGPNPNPRPNPKPLPKPDPQLDAAAKAARANAELTEKEFNRLNGALEPVTDERHADRLADAARLEREAKGCARRCRREGTACQGRRRRS